MKKYDSKFEEKKAATSSSDEEVAGAAATEKVDEFTKEDVKKIKALF